MPLLKFLLIIGIISFLAFRVIGLFFRLLSGSPSNPKPQDHTYHNYRGPKDGNINVDYVPGKQKKPSKEFKGGEYVDYEEID